MGLKARHGPSLLPLPGSTISGAWGVLANQGLACVPRVEKFGFSMAAHPRCDLGTVLDPGSGFEDRWRGDFQKGRSAQSRIHINSTAFGQRVGEIMHHDIRNTSVELHPIIHGGYLYRQDLAARCLQKLNQAGFWGHLGSN